MKNTVRVLFIALLFINGASHCFAQSEFSKWFENKALRIDYYLAGNADSEHFYLDDLREEPFWAAHPTR